jgi:cytochrome c-type biogenesis protein CcmH
MIGFWIAAGALLAATLAGLLWPLIRQRRRPETPEPAVAVFRRELADLDVDLAQGRLEPDAAEAARAEITRRLLAADRPATEITGDPAAEMRWRTGAAVAIAALLPAAALGVYFVVGAPATLEGRPVATAAAPPPAASQSVELAAAAEQLAARLERDPNHPEGWILLARTDAALGRFAAAETAYRRAIGLSPDKPELHAELGEILVAKAQGRVTTEAGAEFAKAPAEPRSRFYRAEAALQRGDKAQAAAELRKLLADAPADASWRGTVAAKLAEISGASPPAASSASGPSAEDVAAAQSMSPGARQAMIRGMVERLAARLEQHPDDREGWARLAHAYDVLGEPEKAAQARAHLAGPAPPQATAPTGR